MIKKDNHGFVVAVISHDTKESVLFQMANKEQQYWSNGILNF
jgi:hypothetical protein